MLSYFVLVPLTFSPTLTSLCIGDVANDDEEDEEEDNDAIAEVKLFRADLAEFPLTVPDFIF